MSQTQADVTTELLAVELLLAAGVLKADPVLIERMSAVLKRAQVEVFQLRNALAVLQVGTDRAEADRVINAAAKRQVDRNGS